METKVSSDITVSFEPWTTVEGISISSLKIHEELGGSLPHGSAELVVLGKNDAFNFAMQRYTGYIDIIKEGVCTIHIDIFVINRRFYQNVVFLDFICVYDKRFFTELKSIEYTDITDTLMSIYPGKTNISCESDINNSVPLIQFMETDHSFCTKLALSFKKNIVFGFGWDTFLIKDLKEGINHKGEKEVYDSEKKTIENVILLGGTGAEDSSYTNAGYDFKRYIKPWDPWEKPEDETRKDYSMFSALNSRTLKYHDNYLTLSKDYYNLVDNYLYNNELLNSNLFCVKTIKINDIPDYKLGDVLTYKHLSELDIDLPYKTFLVKSNTFRILLSGGMVLTTGSGVAWESEIVSLVDSRGELLPETDPTDAFYEG